MKAIKKALLIILGVFAASMCLCGIICLAVILRYADFQEGKAVVMVICSLMIVGFGLAAFKCFKVGFCKKEMQQESRSINLPTEEMLETPTAEIFTQPAKEETVKQEDVPIPVIQANIIQPKIPQKVLRDIRMTYTGHQAVNDMRIIQESLAIMEKTADIDTFLSRYETAMKCVQTLEQAKKAGQRIALSEGVSQSLVSVKNKALSGVLYRSFKKELDEINKLKTYNGKLNRINRYQEKLKAIYETEIQFVADEAYRDIMQKLNFIKNG